MKCDLLYEVVFSHQNQNSLESIAILNMYYRPDRAKLWEWMCMWLSILFPLSQWIVRHLNLMLSTVKTLPAELNMRCKCSLASNPNKVHRVLQGKKVACLLVREFHQLYLSLFFHFSFYLPFKYATSLPIYFKIPVFPNWAFHHIWIWQVRYHSSSY